jgi:hypothetical protein
MDPAFTTDGSTLYATRVVKRLAYTIVVSRRAGDKWARPNTVLRALGEHPGSRIR